jgi:hypothetical protein
VPIAQWSTRRLGENAPQPGRQPLVLLLRSVLLQRYPGTAVYAVRGVQQGTQRRPPDEPGEEKTPLFRGNLEPDVSFFGFDLDPVDAVGNPGWYFVLQQQPTEPRFGFDEPADFAGASHASVRKRPGNMPELPATTPWAANAAQLADLIRQRPVRVLIHASELLPPPKAPASPAPAPQAVQPPPPRPPLSQRLDPIKPRPPRIPKPPAKATHSTKPEGSSAKPSREAPGEPAKRAAKKRAPRAQKKAEPK